MQFGFDAILTSTFKGKAALKINTVGNNPINFQLPLSDVVGKSVIGGEVMLDNTRRKNTVDIERWQKSNAQN